jgi:hypothetical protein
MTNWTDLTKFHQPLHPLQEHLDTGLEYILMYITAFQELWSDECKINLHRRSEWEKLYKSNTPSFDEFLAAATSM